MGDFDLDGCALRLIGGGACADTEEILDAINYLESKIIGTRYYDGEGDELLKQIVVYLKRTLINKLLEKGVCPCLAIKGSCTVCENGVHACCNWIPHGNPEELYRWFKEHPEFTKQCVPLSPSPEHTRAIEEIKKEEDASK